MTLTQSENFGSSIQGLKSTPPSQETTSHPTQWPIQIANHWTQNVHYERNPR